ncbi:MAG: PilZ domain-containing protein [Desulfobulbus sp.]|nr:PilZ domain-containing protein [Desulfobulbus sp.]
MSRLDELLAKIADNVPAVVDIPGQGGEMFRCNALVTGKKSPALELLFPPDAWQAEDLRLDGSCSIAVEHQGQKIVLIARLEQAIDNRRLLFIAREPITPESLRDYFRVPINTPVKASYTAEQRDTRMASWKITGTALDLSGSGMLAMFSEKPPSSQRILLEITPPENPEPIFCLANVIRSYRVRRNRFQIAFHFIEMTSKTRDQIVSCCLKEQRRQLRENVQTP